ncbi:MAG: hypothetical protein V7756_04755 [Halopseudomonas sp.]|uniref:hypothetical protein n=1 Tax=Halopseudomonas sp. TaxID=2901191 RepID=UPI003002BC33
MWPRQYAAKIQALPTKEERQAALAEVPEDYRDLVKTHVKNAWYHPRANKKSK